MSAVAINNPTLERAVCIGCGYRLFALQERRCPECGRGFDPNDPQTVSAGPWDLPRRRVRRLAKAIASVATAVLRTTRAVVPYVLPAALVWITVWVPQTAVAAMAVVPIVVAYVLLRRRWAAGAIMIATSPVVVLAMLHARDYASGRPPYVAPRTFLHAECGSIDPITRCARRDSGGCGNRDRSGWAVLSELLLRPVERTMYKLAGRPPGTYDGPYPSRAEAIAAVRSGEVIAFDGRGEMKLGGRTVTINGDLSGYYYGYILYSAVPPTDEPVLAKLLNGRCLLVRTPVHDRTGQWYPARVDLIDFRTGQHFALYFDPERLPAGDRRGTQLPG